MPEDGCTSPKLGGGCSMLAYVAARRSVSTRSILVVRCISKCVGDQARDCVNNVLAPLRQTGTSSTLTVSRRTVRRASLAGLSGRKGQVMNSLAPFLSTSGNLRYQVDMKLKHTSHRLSAGRAQTRRCERTNGLFGSGKLKEKSAEARRASARSSEVSAYDRVGVWQVRAGNDGKG